MGVYTCEATNDMGQMFAVLSVPDNEDLPDIDSDDEEEEEEQVKTVNRAGLRSGSMTCENGPIFFISMAITVFFKIRA